MTIARVTAKKLSSKEQESLIGKLSEHLTSLPGLIEIRIFGSAATRTMTEASDLDAVLIFNSAESAKKGSKLAYQTWSSVGWPADLLCIDQALYEEKSRVGGVMFVAAKEGKTIYRRGEHDTI